MALDAPDAPALRPPSTSPAAQVLIVEALSARPSPRALGEGRRPHASTPAPNQAAPTAPSLRSFNTQSGRCARTTCLVHQGDADQRPHPALARRHQPCTAASRAASPAFVLLRPDPSAASDHAQRGSTRSSTASPAAAAGQQQARPHPATPSTSCPSPASASSWPLPGPRAHPAARSACMCRAPLRDRACTTLNATSSHA